MREWRTLPVNCTTRQVIEDFNVNARSSKFMDYVTGTIMNNGLLFTGKETVEGALIAPLKKVNLEGIVNSNTIFDNFRMYFRGTDEIVELNNFPVDLTAFNDNKPHFLYIKEDRTYRVSDYIFGQADEVLICRFIINTNHTWQQMYIVAQRAGTPMYYSGEEFYSLDGIYVKSPGGLNLSHTDGIVKRSGIEFTDLFSPDVYRDTSVSSVKCPIRYTNLSNEVDYTQPITYNIDPNKYMTYDFNAKKKTWASERIRNIFNSIYGIDDYANEMGEQLHHALTIEGVTQTDLREIVDIFVSYMSNIYSIIDEFKEYISDSYFNSINKTRLNKNISDYEAYEATYFGSSVTIAEDTVQRIKDAAYYLVSGNSNVYSDPIDAILNDMYDAINDLAVSAGTLKTVPSKKFTIQRILWDIYEQCLIVQYGDKVYDILEDAVADIGNMLYPVPFGHLFYIPLAGLIVQQGTTDINANLENCFIIKQYMYADSEQEGFADYIARSLANKALDWCNKLEDTKLNRDGTQPMTGTLKAQTIIPVTNNTYDLGSSTNRWRNLYVNSINSSGGASFGGNATIGGNLTVNGDTVMKGDLTIYGALKNNNGGQYVITGPTKLTAVRLEADSKANIDAAWGNYQRGTVAVCW